MNWTIDGTYTYKCNTLLAISVVFPWDVKQKRYVCSVQPSVQHTTQKLNGWKVSVHCILHIWHSNLPWLTRHSIKFRQFLHIAAQLIHHAHHYMCKGLNHEWKCRCNKSCPVLMQVSHVVLGAEKMQLWMWTVLPLPILASYLNDTDETSLKSTKLQIYRLTKTVLS